MAVSQRAMTAPSTSRLLVASALVALLVAACGLIPPPYRVDLWKTSWQVTAIDGDATDVPITMSFNENEEDGAVTIRTPCGIAHWGIGMDSDGHSIDFGGPDIATESCDAPSAAATLALVSALRSTDGWSVEDNDHITLLGEQHLSLTRDT